MKVIARMKDINENGIQVEDDISNDTKTPPKDTAAFESNKVLANVNSHGSGT